MRARRILKTKRIGHSGTLDPFATGVLVLLVGQATRLAQFINTDEKEYLAVARCGFATDTGDLTGSPIEEKAVGRDAYSLAEVESALVPLRGEIEQIPPMYSAKKVEGRKLYELARRGEVIERKPVQVHIKELEHLEYSADDTPAGCWDLSFRVVCSSGTYVRTLAEEIGKNLGTAAHLTALRRTRAGRFSIEDGVTMDEMAGGNVRLLPSPRALEGIPRMQLDPVDTRRVRNGMRVFAEGFLPDESVALFDEGENLLGVGRYDAGEGVVKPKVMMATG